MFGNLILMLAIASLTLQEGKEVSRLRITGDRAGALYPPPPETIRWDGRDVAVADVTVILVAEAGAPATEKSRRIAALMELRRVANALRGTALVPRLIDLYNDVDSEDEKAAVLQVVYATRDVRGLALYAAAVNDAESPALRLLAAGALADWNVLQGVRSLIKLLDTDAKLPGGQGVANEALKLLQSTNRAKGWGFPEKELTNPILLRGDLTPGEKVRLVAPLYKAWLEENQQRFPEWRSGDPLPEVADQDD